MKLKDAIIRVIDCETTGLDAKEHKVVEIACVDMNYSRGILRSTSQLIKPCCKIPLEAMAIHHITDEMIKDAPTLEEVWPSLRDENGPIDAMAAHNAQFEASFLKTELPIICTFRVARHLWPELEAHSNQYLRHYLEVDVDPNTPIHRALGDATVTALILQKMMKIAVEEKGITELDALISWAAEPVLLNKIHFGKHYGLKWSEAPVDYLRWMKSTWTNWDLDLRYTVEHYLGERR